MDLPNPDLDRHARIRSWLHGEPRHCLLLLPDHIESPQAVVRALGLEAAATCLLRGGTMRPSFEPDPEFVGCVRRDRDLRDIVLVTTADLFQGRRLPSRRHAVDVLERQLERIIQYRTGFGIACLPPEVQLHGWLWERERGWLAPYAWESQDLDVEVRVRLPATTSATDLPPRAGWGGMTTARASSARDRP